MCGSRRALSPSYRPSRRVEGCRQQATTIALPGTQIPSATSLLHGEEHRRSLILEIHFQLLCQQDEVGGADLAAHVLKIHDPVVGICGDQGCFSSG